MSINPRRVSVVILAATALFATSCGDDSSSGDTTLASVVDTTVSETTVPDTTAPATTVATTAPATSAPTTVAPTTVAATTATTKAAGATTTAKATTTVATTAPATSTTVGKPTKSEMVIGVPLAVTGSSGPTYKYGVDVATAWQSWVNNDLGGINGHPVRLVLKDTKSDAATTSSVSNELVQQDKVIAVVGAADSSTEAVWGKVFGDAKVPTIPSTCFNPAVCNGIPGIFHMSTGIPGAVQVQDIAAKANGASKFGLLSFDANPTNGSILGIHKATLDSAGLTFGGEVAVSASSPSYTAPCLTFQSAGLDFIQLSIPSATAVRVIEDCASQGYRPLWGATGGTVIGESLIPASQKGAVFGGGLNAFPWWVNDAPVRQYRDIMTKYSAGKEYRTPSATAVWASLELFRKAMANASANPTSAEVMTAMNSVKNETLGGLLPQPISYTEGKPSPPVNCFWIYRLANGNFSGSYTPSCYP